mgnify:CR=1 FL=1
MVGTGRKGADVGKYGGKLSKQRYVSDTTFKKIQKKTNPIIPYGVECELTCDCDGEPKYGDAFTVDRLPKRLKNNAYFVVTKIGQNFSGGDWTTTISGLMMIKAD